MTVLVASGNDGALGRAARRNPEACRYSPSYPATSQFVTAVGATFGPERGFRETACQSHLGGIVTSGGGFSGRVPVPSWQRDSVSGYFDGLRTKPYPGYGRGRGIPDVSLLAHNHQVSIAGEDFILSGYVP